MRKTINLLAGALVAMLLVAGLTIHKADARLTGTNPGTDVWCMGITSYEVCVDSIGRIIPTTTNNQTLGTSSLRFSNIFSVLGNFSGAITADSISLTTGVSGASIADSGVTSNKIATGAVTSTKLSSSAVTSNKLSGMSGSSASGKLLCAKVNGDIGSCTTATSAVGTVCDVCN